MWKQWVCEMKKALQGLLKEEQGVLPAPELEPSHKMLSGTNKVSFDWKAGKQDTEEIIFLVQWLTPLSY